MAKKQQPFVTPPEDDEKPVELTPAEEAEQAIEDDDLQTILDTCQALDLTGGHVKMWLRRKGETEGNYVGKMSIESFRKDGLDTLAAGPGGGNYTFKFCNSDGQFVKQRMLSIDPRFKGNLGDPSPVAKPDDERIEKIVATLKPAEPRENMMPLLITLITESNKTIAGMMSSNQQATNTILSGMMSALTSAQTKPGTDPALLELIRLKTDKTPLTETIEAMQMLRELDGGGAPKDDMIEKLVKMLGPPLMQMLTNRGAMQPQMQQAQIAQAPPAEEVRGQRSEVGTLTSAGSPEPKLAAFIPMLLNAARKGTDAATYCDVICDTISEAQFDELITDLEKPTWFETLFGAHAEVEARRAWFEQLREEFLKEDPEQEQAPAPKEATQ